MSYQHVFLFERPLPKLQSDQMHRMVRARYRKVWHQRVAEYVMVNGPRNVRPASPLTRCRIDCTRHSLIRGDGDNIAYSFKPVIDGLKHAFIIEDDNDYVVVERWYGWEKADHVDHQAITVVVTELPPASPSSRDVGANPPT